MSGPAVESMNLRIGDPATWIQGLRARRSADEEKARRIAEKIVSRVERGGDEAISELLREIDGVSIPSDRVVVRPDGGAIDRDLEQAVELAIERVTMWHEPQRSSTPMRIDDLEMQLLPLDRVGIYVPGGSAVYLSTLIMCAVPARIAGVKEIVVATTPRVAAMPELVWACRRLGVQEIVRTGGAAGVAAMAFGTRSLRPVQKIVGPGNAYVNEAKKLIRDRVGIDLPAGPSEIVVICDETADTAAVAADMLAQAEHGSDSLAVCLTTSTAVAEAVEAEIARRLEGDAGRARPAIERFGSVIVVEDTVAAAMLADEIAPEHLSIQVADPESVVDRIRNCAAIFVGRNAPVALGDYVAGSNHVLPTAGTAMFCSALGVADFVKRRTIVRMSGRTLAEIGPAAVTLAEYEGLPLHAESVRSRLRGATCRSRAPEPVVPAAGSRQASRVDAGVDYIPGAIRAMRAYTLEPREARDKLDQNESPFDMPYDRKQRILDRMVARRWNRYPDFEAIEVRDAFAAHAGVSRDNVLVGNGSNELLMVTLATLVREGTRVIIPIPTFPLYETFATVFGGSVVRVPIDPTTGRLPVDEMIPAIESSERPALVIVCSPNNPTGGVLGDGDLGRLLDTGAFVILDRAYGEFHDDGPPQPRDRLVTLSTLSKAWGLASLRVGWLLSTPAICRELRKVKLPYNLNAFSQEAAIAVLSERELTEARINDAVKERERLRALMNAVDGIEVFPSRANFLTFRLQCAVGPVFNRLQAEGILVRNVAHYAQLSGCLRVSVGSPEQNDRFVKTLRMIVGQGE